MIESKTKDTGLDLSPLTRELRALRFRLRGLYLAFGLARVLGLAALLAMLTFVLDWTLDLPRGARLLLFSLSAALLVYSVHRYLLYPLSRRFSDADLARAVEDRFPELKDSLLSALQLAVEAEAPDFADSRALVAEVVAQARRKVAEVPFSRIVDRARLGRALALAAIPAGVVLIGAAFMPEASGIWVQRMLAFRDVPWPRQTWLEVIPFRSGKNLTVDRRGDQTIINIARGSDLAVLVKANGRVPSQVEVVYWALAEQGGDSGQREVRPMTRTGDRDFSYQFLALTRSFRFYVQGGDDRDGLPLFLVNVKVPPKVELLDLALIPPPYTLEEPKTQKDGNIEAPEGTQVSLSLTTNLDVRSADLVMLAVGASRPLERQGARRFSGKFVVEKTTPYTISLEGEDGLSNQNPVRYYIKSIADLPPKVKILTPSSVEMDGTIDAFIPIRSEITDDYGTSRVSLMVRMGRGAVPEMPIPFKDGSILTPEKTPPTGPARRLFANGEIDLRTLAAVPSGSTGGDASPPPLRSGDAIRFAVEASDNHVDGASVATPNVSRSQEHRISIITKSELERKLNDWQLRLKEDVTKVKKSELARLDKLDGVIVSVNTPDGPVGKSGPGDFSGRTDILDLEVAHNRAGSEIRRVESDFFRIFDLYVYNRIDNSTVGERVLHLLVDLDRASDSPLDAYRQLVAQAGGGSFSESELLSKLVSMMSLFIDAAETYSPAVSDSLGKARSTLDAEVRLSLLKDARKSSVALVDALQALLDKMNEWEDFQEVLQITRELYDFQKGIKTRTSDEIIKRNEKTKPR